MDVRSHIDHRNAHQFYNPCACPICHIIKQTRHTHTHTSNCTIPFLWSLWEHHQWWPIPTPLWHQFVARAHTSECVCLCLFFMFKIALGRMQFKIRANICNTHDYLALQPSIQLNGKHRPTNVVRPAKLFLFLFLSFALHRSLFLERSFQKLFRMHKYRWYRRGALNESDRLIRFRWKTKGSMANSTTTKMRSVFKEFEKCCNKRFEINGKKCAIQFFNRNETDFIDPSQLVFFSSIASFIFIREKKRISPLLFDVCVFFFSLHQIRTDFSCVFGSLFCLLITWFLLLKFYAYIFGARYVPWHSIHCAHIPLLILNMCRWINARHVRCCMRTKYSCMPSGWLWNFESGTDGLDGNEFAVNFRGPPEFAELNFKLTAL